MQEEVENKTIALVISAARLTARELKLAVDRYLAHQKAQEAGKAARDSVKPCGKQSVKALIGQNQGVSKMEISTEELRGLRQYAGKYGVDYAIRRDRSGEKPRYFLFFKARDADAFEAALSEYTAAHFRKGKEKAPSLTGLLREGRAIPVPDRPGRRKEREL